MQAELEAVKTITFEPFQSDFVNSAARYPFMVAGWGTGKTMCMLARGLRESIKYPNNLGLICRKNFTDLRDSTIRDFERYTGVKVPLTSKEAKIPNTNSIVMFRHADELSKLQNINLGWFGIEQAEEFETAEAFDMLRGRLRRENTGRIGMCIANQAGHNWIWRRVKKELLEGYSLVEARTSDNAHNLPADFLRDLARMQLDSPKKWARYVDNSWEDYDLEGAFYAKLMSDALKAGRVDMDILYESTLPVYTFWDLGVRASDTTAIWFGQFIKNEIHAVDYYENYGEGMDHYSAWLDSLKYRYGGHYLPHDAKNRLQSHKVETRIDILRGLRVNEPVHLVAQHAIEDRIAEVRRLIPKCRFSTACRQGVECLNHYKRKRNDVLSTESKDVFHPEPLHDWASNGADAFGYLAMAYRYMPIGGEHIGYPYPIAESSEAGDSGGGAWDHDVFEATRRNHRARSAW